MAIHLSRRDAKSEAIDALNRHLEVIAKIREIHFDKNLSKDGFFYLTASPIIYSAWEGFFRLSCSICLRRKCQRGRLAKKYDELYSTLWLQKESFLEKFLSTLLTSMVPGKDAIKPGAGKFTALADLNAGLNGWHQKPLNHAVNFDKIVMTYSNVKPDVVELNARIIGLDITSVDLSKLNELLGRRNDVAHGGLITYPQEVDIRTLLDYAEKLVKDFHSAVIAWINVN